ncbi:hypothetical protein FaHV1S18_028 [Falconid herpesvirus 1]|uniref:Uncharacterized protein n=2 Tax=Columbid alphaherpesvirus 1 TaxID=93386 RepID=A0A068EPI2_9ALPH|nr:hypothetical protein FaHV1S18_028 [Falconid herpesvirus 1]YP_009352922.1 hypothetical protein CoHVHLJ_028 [Columbid alphaherpesvirus 1]AID52718.1 hypothetical protein FaHV1S18_028 [Falconid herpesvirus 1]ARD71339.1 hypothetical protein CoHVHLJ_028 [Columbid alphaherpesvirus 1]
MSPRTSPRAPSRPSAAGSRTRRARTSENVPSWKDSTRNLFFFSSPPSFLSPFPKKTDSHLINVLPRRPDVRGYTSSFIGKIIISSINIHTHNTHVLLKTS